MQSASQATAFYREIAASGQLWTVRDANGFPAPLNPEGKRAQPFWSSRSRVDRVIRMVAAYQQFTPVEIDLESFLSRWVPGLAKDGVLVGVNWSGPKATGYDVSPAHVAENIRHFLRSGT